MNIDLLFTAEEAAAEVGVKRQTIYTWVNRGLLAPATKQGHTRLFRLEDVFNCEKTRDRTRRSAQRGASLSLEDPSADGPVVPRAGSLAS